MKLERIQKPIAIYAHPDDESIGCSQAIHALRDKMHVVFVTDGMPSPVSDPHYYSPQTQYSFGEEYLQMRRQEARTALACLGLTDQQRISFLGGTDNELASEIDLFTTNLRTILAALQPDLIFTHAYEGGHLDHDLVCAAVWALTRDLDITLCETPLYSQGPEGMLHNLSPDRHQGWPNFHATPSASSILRKRASFEAYASQNEDLRYFSPLDPEPYAFASRRSMSMDSFTRLPNQGMVAYPPEKLSLIQSLCAT